MVLPRETTIGVGGPARRERPRTSNFGVGPGPLPAHGPALAGDGARLYPERGAALAARDRVSASVASQAPRARTHPHSRNHSLKSSGAHTRHSGVRSGVEASTRAGAAGKPSGRLRNWRSEGLPAVPARKPASVSTQHKRSPRTTNNAVRATRLRQPGLRFHRPRSRLHRVPHDNAAGTPFPPPTHSDPPTSIMPAAPNPDSKAPTTAPPAPPATLRRRIHVPTPQKRTTTPNHPPPHL